MTLMDLRTLDQVEQISQRSLALDAALLFAILTHTPICTLPLSRHYTNRSSEVWHRTLILISKLQL